MVKSKTNKFKAVFIAVLLFSVLASALTPIFIEKDLAQADVESSIDDPVPKDS